MTIYLDVNMINLCRESSPLISNKMYLCFKSVIEDFIADIVS
jgi:hypothetical protein